MSEDNYVCVCPGSNSPYICRACEARERFEAIDDRIEEFCGNCDSLTKNVLGEDEICEECMCFYQEKYIRKAIIRDLCGLDYSLHELRDHLCSAKDTLMESSIYWLIAWLKDEFNWRLDTHDIPDIIHSIAKKEDYAWADKILILDVTMKWRASMKEVEEIQNES